MLAGTVPSSKKYLDGTVPASKKLVDGTSKKGREGVVKLEPEVQ